MTPRDSLAAFFLNPDESEENNVCHVSTDVSKLPALFLPLISAVVSLEGAPLVAGVLPEPDKKASGSK